MDRDQPKEKKNELLMYWFISVARDSGYVSSEGNLFRILLKYIRSLLSNRHFSCSLG